MSLSAIDAFATALKANDGGVDQLRAAAAIALIAYPDLDVDGVLAAFDALAEDIRAEAGPASSLDTAIAGLNRALFVERGFSGNRDAYDDPRNSYLHEVLERRTGIPITLSLVYVELGRRLGLPLDGVGFPAHFIVRAGDEQRGYRYLDPFNGGNALARDDLAAFLRRQGGDPDRQLETFLTAVTPRQLLARILYNLEGMYVRRGDLGMVRSVLDLHLVLEPWSLDRVRDRGLVSFRLGDREAAAADLAAYLEHEPDAADAARVRAVLDQIRRQTG